MKKIILSSLVAILVLGGAAGSYWWISRPQVIKFSDDTTLTLLGADYGKRHAVPGGKLPKAPATTPSTTTVQGARLVQTVRRTGNGSFNTPNDSLVVWVRAKYEYVQNQYHGFQFYVYDSADTACAQNYTSRVVSGNQRGDDVLAIQFDSFPRREGKLVVRAQENYSGGNEMADNKFTIPNPAAKKTFAKWTAEPMPNKQTDGELAMTLTKLVAGADLGYARNQDNPDDAMNKGVKVAFTLARNGQPVSNWSPVSAETTDATGNRTTINYGTGGNQVRWQGDEGAFTYQYGLWPDEPAWKVRIEMTQNSDFSSDEQWTAENIPVVPGSQQSFNQNFNSLAGVRGGFGGRGAASGRGAAPVTVTPAAAPTPCAEADLGGRHIKVFPAVLFTNQPARPAGLPANVVFNQPQQTGFMIQVQPAIMNYNGTRPVNVGGVNGAQTPDDGMRLSLAKVTDGQGGEFPQSYNYSPVPTSTGTDADSISTFRYTLRDTGDVTNLNLTISLHKNRFFEFTVKPEKASAE